MKKILTMMFMLFSVGAMAQTVITINSPYSPAHSGQAAFRLVLDTANQAQSKYRFILTNKPGAEGLIALRDAERSPETTLTIITAAYVDLINRGQVIEQDYRPIHAIGDFSWALVANGPESVVDVKSLTNLPELVIGSPGVGNSIHLTGLEISRLYNIPTRLILFKSANDGFVNMAGNQGVTLAFERISNVQQMSERNPALRIVGVSGPQRNSKAPNVKTLAEQGIHTPAPFNIVMANKNMSQEVAAEIGGILDSATIAAGMKKIVQSSDIVSPVFFPKKISAQEFYNMRVQSIRHYQAQFKEKINNLN